MASGPINMQQGGGWQNYAPNPNPQWIVNSQGQQTAYPNQQIGQNGGNFQTQQNQPSQFIGRFITRIDEVTPGEVPMDGRIALFPTQNLDEVYLKAWNRDGMLMTVHYILDPNQASMAPSPPREDPIQSQILERLDQLEKRISDASTSSNQRKSGSKGGDN